MAVSPRAVIAAAVLTVVGATVALFLAPWALLVGFAGVLAGVTLGYFARPSIDARFRLVSPATPTAVEPVETGWTDPNNPWGAS